MLQPLRSIFDPKAYPDLLVGLDAADDAAVYRLTNELAIVTTTDFFPPVVDDPYDFGAIAAANALSDIYAMGGRPLYAINLVAYPDGLGLEHLQEILRGGAEKVAEAGAVIAGGHSVSDREPKYGLAVTGIVDPTRILTKSGGRPGDVLVLTKPLGTGVITTALKQQRASEEHVSAAVASMKRLNDRDSEVAIRCGVVSMTDVTGFGFLGHAREMAHAASVGFEIREGALPWLAGAHEYAAAAIFPGGTLNNQRYFSPWVTFDGVTQAIQDLLWSPETSGGLLAAVPSDELDHFLRLSSNAVPVGRVIEGDGRISVIGD